MSATPEPVGTLEIALAHARRLLQQDPSAAAEQAVEILKAVPGHPVAQLLLGVARRSSGATPEAIQILTALSKQQPQWAAAHFELGLAFGAQRQGDEAVVALRRAVALKPDLPDAWRTLADHLSAAGDAEGADHAYAQHIRYSTRDPRLLDAGVALSENQIPVAEALLREHLKQHPTDVAAIRMFAEVAARLGRYADAEALLERCLELAPSFQGARHNYAYVLNRQNKLAKSLEQLERLLSGDPRNPGYRNLQAAVLGRAGEYDRALQIYAGVVKEYPSNAKVWMSYGHALEDCRSAGRMRHHVSPRHRVVAAARRGLLESRESENIPLQ